CDVDPAALERIREVRHLAPYVREYQDFAMKGAENPRTMTVIVAVADEFATCLSPDEYGRSPSPNAVLNSMVARADETSRPVIEALMSVLRVIRSKRVA
ncbi:MAG: hypothetical protein ACYDGM_00150, partial [Vulcanimicrobiaceae bacterium]